VRVYAGVMASKRHSARLGFVVFAVLTILGLFVLDGAAAGATLLAAMFALILACISALRGQDPADVNHTERVGLSGWIGGWF
jgi:hypothetical protein